MKKIKVKCIKGSESFTYGKIYSGVVVCDTSFLTQYRLIDNNKQSLVVNADRFEIVK